MTKTLSKKKIIGIIVSLVTLGITFYSNYVINHRDGKNSSSIPEANHVITDKVKLQAMLKDMLMDIVKDLEAENVIRQAKEIDGGRRVYDYNGTRNRLIVEQVDVDEDVVIMIQAISRGKIFPIPEVPAKPRRLGVRLSLKNKILYENENSYLPDSEQDISCMASTQIHLKPGRYCFEALGIYSDNIKNDHVELAFTVFKTSPLAFILKSIGEKL
ncbi:MAG: hypothetical protein GY757_34705 [bacterium]|nr:hypothetical protein [bacterium]